MTHRNHSTTKQSVNETSTSTNVTSKSTQQSAASSESQTIDLPTLPQKKRNRNQIVTQHHFTLPTSYNKQKKRTIDNRKNATLERIATKKSSETHLNDSQQKDSIDSTVTKMHYHNSSDMPKYLFGERTKHYHHHQSKPLKNDEIYLNKSGWVQVNPRDSDSKHFSSYSGALSNLDENRLNVHKQQLDRDASFQKYNSDILKNTGNNLSKIEALISRNEIRKHTEQNKLVNKVKCAIDPQMSALLSERPGFLPIKRFDDNDSPPPITPIISPPPAFQDNNTCSGVDKETQSTSGNLEGPSNKGMVFSRSFEYDTRKPYEYNQTFSKSFDYDFLSPSKEEKNFEKENNFTNLTGISPNYLTKKPNTTTPTKYSSRDSSASGYQQYLDPKNYVEPVKKSRVRSAFSLRPDSLDQQQQAERSRRGQFSKQESSSSASGSNRGFRSQQSNISKRLNSCDSGARSGNFFKYFSIFPFWLNFNYRFISTWNLLVSFTTKIFHRFIE